ncbi:MAG: DUF5663 domain-containing protein [Candidatus Saccharimonas sp.]
MFEINDDFLASVGYDVASLSDSQKQQYIQEFTTEVNERVSERLLTELDDDQVNEFNELQDSADRAKQWVGQFHAGYTDDPEYKQILDNTGNEDEAVALYATAKWLNDAIPRYGELIQEELNAYQAQLVKMREAATSALDQ